MAHAEFFRWNKAGLFLALVPTLTFGAMSEEEMFFKGVADVNEGDLHFLSAAPPNPIHHHQNKITLNAESLLNGWAKLEQCHFNLDPVPDMQIVYSRDRIRNLTVVRSENIGHSQVQENTVQMQQVAHDAVICITAETRALKAEENNRFTLSNGPYMRRFLDGYYPMRVSMRVSWDMPDLHFVDITPSPQSGFSLTESANEVAYEALFEGALRTQIIFSTQQK